MQASFWSVTRGLRQQMSVLGTFSADTNRKRGLVRIRRKHSDRIAVILFTQYLTTAAAPVLALSGGRLVFVHAGFQGIRAVGSRVGVAGLIW